MTGRWRGGGAMLAGLAASLLAVSPGPWPGVTSGPAASHAWAADPVAVITEIRSGQGEARVKRAEDAEWTPAQPLLSLRPGDQVRVTGAGRVVLVYAGGLGNRTVSASTSPFTVEAPRGQSSAPGILASVTGLLFGKEDRPAYVGAYVPLSTRSARVPPTPLAPRETKVLPGAIRFEWAGSELLRYRVRLLGPGGLLWEQGDLRRGPLVYPPSAPPLQAGTRYAWELHAERHPMQRAEFEVLAPADAARVRSGLASLDPAALAGYAPATGALMRAAFLMQENLLADARRELLDGLAASGEEPSLHHLLGHVYDRTGLRELAADSFDEARFLSEPRP